MKSERIPVLSYGGGLNSSALLVWLIDHDVPLREVIFADPGRENPQTYEAVEYFGKLAEDKGIRFTTVRAHYPVKDIYEYYFIHKALPSLMHRDCTAKFKRDPIRRHLRKTYAKGSRFLMYIGIAFDEAHRLKDSDVRYIKNEFTLAYEKITRDGCTRILEDGNHMVPPKSGCDICPFQKREEWVRMYKENRALFDEARALEENCSRYPEFTLKDKFPLSKVAEYWGSQLSLDSWGGIGEENEPEPGCDPSGGCFL